MLYKYQIQISEAEYAPLPPLTTTVYHTIFRVFAAKTALPAYMLEMHCIVVTQFANSFGRKRPALVKQRHIKIRLQSNSVGKMWYGLKEIPIDFRILASQGVVTTPGSVVVTFDVCSNKSPVNYADV